MIIYQELQNYTHRFLRPVLLLERVISHRRRRRIKHGMGLLLVGLVVFALAVFVLNFARDFFTPPDFFEVVVAWLPQVWGVIFIAFFLYLILFLLESFYYYYYFRARDLMSSGKDNSDDVRVSFEVGSILFRVKGTDVTRGFVLSRLGRIILARCGINGDALDTFMDSRKAPNTEDTFSVELPTVTLSHFSKMLYEYDKEFGHFLFSYGLTKNDFENCAGWVERSLEMIHETERWWSKNNLSRIPGIGKDWTYGNIYLIEKYGRDMINTPVYSSVLLSALHHQDNVEELEITLARGRQSNAFLVGQAGVGKMEVVARLTHKIQEGKIVPVLEHKRVLVLDGSVVVAAMKEKGAFEEELIKIFNQAVGAGNIILVLENFPSFMESARAIGSDIITLLNPYFSSSEIQLVAISDLEKFHKSIESHGRLMKYFEVIKVETLNKRSVVRTLESIALRLESRENVLITYLALASIATSADRYFMRGVMPDKAIDLLEEVVETVVVKKRRVVTKDDVLALVELKTGIPLGEIDEDEREKLLTLEEILHRRIIGQDPAIDAISKAMRRARAGVQSGDRPMGSFLFLGPTGVGKTETAKALTEAFFGGEDMILRLDMSEYHTADGLSRLIGSFESGKPGKLVSLLQDKPYGVLLLDEFEKTSKEVIDLFLQILDEGQFSDMSGKKVNARNVIIIATSNAASDLIWDYFQEGKDVSEHKDEFIDEIIKRAIFKPELLNRFDGVIIFHPIDKKHARLIAALLLEKLQKRLKKNGVELVINDSVVDIVVRDGYSEKFGARSMNHIIQEKVEQVVADKIIREGIPSGTTITLTAEDLK